MKKFFCLFLLLIATALVGYSCDNNYAPMPPIATPNENLPLYELPESPSTEPSSGDGTIQPSPTIPKISATPNVIHVYGSGKEVNSHIVVIAGTFDPSTQVDVWGEVSNPENISDPPLIYNQDEDPSKPNIQMTTDSKGGLEFWLRAGTSTGTFVIFVGTESHHHSVSISIKE